MFIVASPYRPCDRKELLAMHSVSLSLVALAVLITARAYAQEPSEANTPVHPAFPEQAPSLKPTAAGPAKVESGKVSATGAFTFQLPIHVPPGRNGTTPSLSLSYSSARANQASAAGSGWELPHSAIRRS